MDETQNQQRAIEETRERLGQIAGELADRASPPYVKARIKEAAQRQAATAKEAVVRRAVIVEGQVLRSSTTYSLLGALGGWLLGSLIGRRFASSFAERALAENSGSSESPSRIGQQTAEAVASAKDKASEAVAVAKDKATEAVSSAKHRATDAVSAAKERIGGTLSHARERIPSAHDVSDRMGSFIHNTADNRPLLFALIPIGLGALFAMLLPVSDQERRVFSSAKQKVNEQLNALSEKVEERMAAAESGSQPETGSSAGDGTPPSTTDVHIH